MDDATLEKLLISSMKRVDEISLRTQSAHLDDRAEPGMRVRAVLRLSTSSLIELMQIADGQLVEGSVLAAAVVMQRVTDLCSAFTPMLFESGSIVGEDFAVMQRVCDEYNEKMMKEQGQ